MTTAQLPPAMAVPEPKDVDTLKLFDTNMPLTVHSFGMTDTGKVRDGNEDQFLIAVLLKSLQIESTSLPQPQVQHSGDRSYLFVVADGMGGHAGGEQASALAIDSVETFILETFMWFAECRDQDQDRVLADFKSALGQANARVLAEGVQQPALRGMGTTLTLAYSLNDVLFVAHVGDSRCYLCRQGVLYRLTHDHTLVAEMVRAGSLKAEDVAKHRLRHVITNTVGGATASIKVEVHKVQLESNDRLLLCSDGLTEMLPDEEIKRVLQTEADPECACRGLVASANAAGGKDNITVVVAHFRTDSEADVQARPPSSRKEGNGKTEPLTALSR